LPGGRIDVDEFNTPLEKVVHRELAEELGEDVKFFVDINHPKGIGRHLVPVQNSALGQEVHIFYVFFPGKYISGDIKISDEHNEAV